MMIAIVRRRIPQQRLAGKVSDAAEHGAEGRHSDTPVLRGEATTGCEPEDAIESFVEARLCLL